MLNILARICELFNALIRPLTSHDFKVQKSIKKCQRRDAYTCLLRNRIKHGFSLCNNCALFGAELPLEGLVVIQHQKRAILTHVDVGQVADGRHGAGGGSADVLELEIGQMMLDGGDDTNVVDSKKSATVEADIEIVPVEVLPHFAVTVFGIPFCPALK